MEKTYPHLQPKQYPPLFVGCFFLPFLLVCFQPGEWSATTRWKKPQRSKQDTVGKINPTKKRGKRGHLEGEGAFSNAKKDKTEKEKGGGGKEGFVMLFYDTSKGGGEGGV